jgi:WD40 repeat protein
MDSPGPARVYDTQSGELIFEVSGACAGHSLVFPAFSPDGTRVFTAMEDNSGKIWDSNSGDELVSLEGHTQYIKHANFSSDGRFIITGSLDKTARIWEVESGRLLITLFDHKGHVWWTMFSADGRRVLSTDSLILRVWDIGTGEELIRLTGHRDSIWSAKFSPDDTRIITASGDKAVKLWDATTGREIFTFSDLTEQNFNRIRNVNDLFSEIKLNKYVSADKSQTEELLHSAITAMSEDIDPHSVFVEPEDDTTHSEQVASSTSGGVGITARFDDKEGILTIASVSPGSPAHREGLLPGDKIIKIDGENAQVMPLQMTIPGEPGTQITLTIHRPSEETEIELTLTREVIQLPEPSEYPRGGPAGVTFSRDGRQIIVATSKRALRVYEAFPWKEEDYPGDASMPLEERIELYKREYWKKRLNAVPASPKEPVP